MEGEEFPYSQYARPGSKQVKFTDEKFKSISSKQDTPGSFQNDKENSASYNFGGSQSKFPSLKGSKKTATSPKATQHLTKQIAAVESHKFGGTGERKTVKKSEQSEFQKSGAFASYASRFSSSSNSNNGRESSAKLSDLCPKDKAKIGELVKTVAKEKKENSELREVSRRKEEMYKRQIRELSEEKLLVERTADQLRQKFSESLRMLNSMRQHQEELTNSLAQYSSIQSGMPQSISIPTPSSTTGYPLPQKSSSPQGREKGPAAYQQKLISNGTPTLELLKQMQSSSESLDEKKYEASESNQTLEKIQKLKQDILSYQKNIKDNSTFMNVGGGGLSSSSQSRITEEQEYSAKKDYSPTPQKVQKIMVKKVYEEDERMQDTDQSDLEDRRLEEEWRAKRHGRSMEKTKKQKEQVVVHKENKVEKGAVTLEDLALFKDQIAQQLNMLSSMIQGKVGASPSFAEQSELTLGRVTYEAKEGSPTKSKLNQKQQEDSEEDSQAPEPRAPPKKQPHKFDKKMQIYEQIKQRVSTQDSLTSPPTPQISNKFSSVRNVQKQLMKSAAKSSSDLRDKRKLERSAKEQFLGTNAFSQRSHHSPVQFSYSMSGQFRQSMLNHVPPSPDSIPTHDYDENLASELNSRGSNGAAAFMNSQTPGTLRSQNHKFYDDSLFNLIDQIESQGGAAHSTASPRNIGSTSELPLQNANSELIMSRSGVIKVRPKENQTPQSVSQFKVKNANILVEEKASLPSTNTTRAPTRAQVGNQFSFALKTPLSVDRARVQKLYAQEAKLAEDQNIVRPFEEHNSESSDSSLCEGESIPQRDEGLQPHFLKGTVASTMKAMANSKYKATNSFNRRQNQKEPTARRLSFNSKKEQFMSNLKKLNYNYEDVPEQDEFDSSMEEV